MSMIIVGKNAVMEAMKAGRKVEELFLQDNTNKDIFALARKMKIDVTWMDKQELSKQLPPHHQGVGARVAEYEYVSLEDAIRKETPNKVFVMLDGLEDPHNLGAILRSADAFGVDGIIVPKKRSVGITDTVVKVSTGAIEYVDVIQVTNLHQTILRLKEQGFWIVGTDMDTQDTIHDFHVDTDICIVIGSEGKGISRLIRDHCDYIVKIPMKGHINSLNASVSCALVLYEVMRRKGN